jgi:1-deoxy-D-xylulose-5-phosphate reductoisomerase
MKRLVVLGSTGSIGTQTLDLVREPESRGDIEVRGLAAASSWELLLEQVQVHRPDFVALIDEEAAAALKPRLPDTTHLFAGPGAILELVQAADFDVAVHGIVGSAGLPASVAVLEKGARLALANKESLVAAGQHLMRIAREHGGEIIPVDSEHSAIFQCLRGERLDRVRHVWLTASGGPFRTTPLHEMRTAAPEAALCHPNWSMGPRISIGSATLMNKALEVVELHHLFGLEVERIRVVIHPQSIVHSMVEFCDGSVIAQLGPPDMRGPIHFALHHPDRRPSSLKGFDIASCSELTFEEPDLERFPALGLGYRCVTEGSDAGCVLNAADEMAVEAFSNSEISFADMFHVDRNVLGRRRGLDGSIEALLEADRLARADALAEIQSLCATNSVTRT